MSRPEARDGSFSPGSENRLSELYPSFPDAADGLFNGDELSPQASGFGILLTADGGRYEGELFGAKGIGEGELVFTTGMMGYQESLTDPSICWTSVNFHLPINWKLWYSLFMF